MTQSLAQILTTIFNDSDHQLYLVGGSVRDRFLGVESKDLDFATSSRPEGTRRLLELAGPSTIFDIGEKFGTIGAVFGDVKVEITTYRSEWYVDRDRRPVVEYSNSLETDLSRRDFTINAMAEDALKGDLIDPHGGIRDLAARKIRAVGIAAERFREDPLRMLRAVRFASQLSFAIEPSTREAIKAHAHHLDSVSRERIRNELHGILISQSPSHGIRELVELGFAKVFMPELLDLKSTSQGTRAKNVFEHTLRVLQNAPPNLLVRWAALLHDIGKPKTTVESNGEIHFPSHERVGQGLSRSILRRLRLDADSINRVSNLVGMHMRANQYQDDWSDGAVRRLIRDASDDLPRLLDLSRADVTSYRPARVQAALRRVERLRRRCEDVQAAEDARRLQSPLDGHDLMRIFDRPPGPWIRVVKDHLLERVLDGDLASDDAEVATEMAKSFVAANLADETKPAG